MNRFIWVLLALTLAGCGANDKPGVAPPGADYYVRVYATQDGGHVTCVVVYRTGVSCDWQAR